MSTATTQSVKQEKLLRCSFCDKSSNQVKYLVSGPEAKKIYICDECVEIARQIIEKQGVSE
jgi:ATP-dependent Clp protease ATP-binding subunit ClpX